MAILHMETDTVRAVTRQLVRAADLIRDEMQSAVQSANGADWMGVSRDQFTAEIARLAEAINQQAKAARVLSQRVENEVQEWEEVCANLGKGSFHFNLNFLRAMGNLGVIGGADGAAVAGVMMSEARVGSVLGVSTCTPELPFVATAHVTEVPPINYARFSQLAYSDSPQLPKDLQDQGWIFLGDADDLGVKGEGYSGAAFGNTRTGEVVIAHRGTDQWNFNPYNNKPSDVDDDLALTAGITPDQCNTSRSFVNAVQEKLGQDPQFNNYTLVHTGHSLGAALSDLNALKDGVKGISFDNPGTGQIIVRNTAEFPLENRSHLVSYQSNANLINTAGTPAGYTVQLVPKDGGVLLNIPIVQTAAVATHHSLDNIITSISTDTGFPKGYFPPGTDGASHGLHNLDQVSKGEVSGVYGAPACFPPPNLPALY